MSEPRTLSWNTAPSSRFPASGTVYDSPRCECGRDIAAILHALVTLHKFVMVPKQAAPPPLDGLDVERLRRAMRILDENEPGVFNSIAIDETSELPIAQGLAFLYAALRDEGEDK